jgi:homoserine/homoserine lactone efflux protein
MTWQVWSAFALIELALCLTPGPAVLLVLAQSLSRGVGRTMWAIFGILGANTTYFLLSATGIGAILLASYDLFFAIKWIGAAYLVWLGANAFLGSANRLLVEAANGPSDTRKLLASGFILQMANPKALLFFTALVPQFIDPHSALWPQIAILAVTSMAIEFAVQIFYATLAGRFSRYAAMPRFAIVTNRVAGSLLIAAGVGMAAIRRA